MAKLDGGNGTRLWGWQGGSVGNDYANAVAVDPRGDVYACGAAPRGMFVGDQPQAGGEAGTGAGAGEMGAEGQVGNVWSNDDGGGAVADMFVAKVGSAFVCLFRRSRNETRQQLVHVLFRFAMMMLVRGFGRQRGRGCALTEEGCLQHGFGSPAV